MLNVKYFSLSVAMLSVIMQIAVTVSVVAPFFSLPHVKILAFVFFFVENGDISLFPILFFAVKENW
jgi:hypothetical protein